MGKYHSSIRLLEAILHLEDCQKLSGVAGKPKEAAEIKTENAENRFHETAIYNRQRISGMFLRVFPKRDQAWRFLSHFADVVSREGISQFSQLLKIYVVKIISLFLYLIASFLLRNPPKMRISRV